MNDQPSHSYFSEKTVRTVLADDLAPTLLMALIFVIGVASPQGPVDANCASSGPESEEERRASFLPSRQICGAGAYAPAPGLDGALALVVKCKEW